MATNFIEDGDATFELGADSNSDPMKLQPGQYVRSMNMLNRGGVLECRPGYRCLTALPNGNLQGMFIFRPKRGMEVILVAVNGLLYIIEFPFRSFRQLTGVAFSPSARQLFFEQVEQSIILNPDGSITFITPRNLVVIQDGGITSPAVFDGTRAEHQRGVGKIPIGGPMKWIGDRLWVAQGALLFASDINDPLDFTEDVYFATVKAFVLPNEITALARTPSINQAQLLVYTESSTTLIQAGIRDRTLWPITPDMQKEILPSIGCKSSRSLVTHYGYLWWYSNHGLTSLDAALNAEHSSRLPYRDIEMQDSKAKLSSDQSLIAGISFENYLLMSVPHGDKFNRHTWVLDNAVRQTTLVDTPPAWNGFWTGTRPVEWGKIENPTSTRIIYVSADFDGVNRLWEAFTPDRLDEGCPIVWYFETRSYLGNDRLLMRDKQFHYADLYLSEMAGDVDVGVFWAGTARGKYKRVLAKRFKATRGCFRPGQRITMDSKIFAFKKQSRVVRTQEAEALVTKETLSSCGVESPWEEFFDESFQLLVVGSGPCACRGLKVYMEPPKSEDQLLRYERCEDETDENMVRFEGAAADSSNFETAWGELSEDLSNFISIRSVTVTAGGITEVGSGTGRSVISQRDADKIAECSAVAFALFDLERALPKIVSLGAAANTQ